MKITASKLRENIYQILDQVLESGVPVEIVRHGRVVRLVPAEPRGKLASLTPRPYLKTDAEDLVHLDWSDEWKP